jgi:eukaryotic-like serine/threonine-protein kinase
MIGTTLAHYDVVAAVGRGGMGDVWRARDTKLGRDVAIKTLPPEFASNGERLARFEREARLLASLNHSNIGAIYGLEQFGETRFLVLELIEGDTLADRVGRGPIPAEESLKIGLQIAQALEAAHEKGVVHRDLKPANIKVTSDGKVKVFDFGLAKALAGDEPNVNVSNSPTLTAAATRQGLILGTAAYMSPEQARGRATDKRADIWAFGCVLFECLTGRAAFPGEDVSDILASVLKSEPDWGRLPANLNPRVRELLHRCLQKDPQQRYRDIGDVRMEIDSLLADSPRLLVPSDDMAQARSSTLPWVAAIALAILSGTSAWYLKPASAVPP